MSNDGQEPPPPEWSFKTMKISEIREHARNPRKLNKHDAEHLGKSLGKFGQCDPLIVNLDGTLIGGHQRLRTLKKMGKKKVIVSVPDHNLSDEEVDELNIRLNRNAGEWDYDILANAWELNDLLDWGFTEKEFSIDAEIIKEVEDAKKEEKEEKCKECPSCGYRF